jgi:tetratricopeptide (TPR) repeat protein
VGRNDPCPCGSGKRYKQCHGAIGSAQRTAVAAPATAPPGQSDASAAPAAPIAPSPDALVARAADAHRQGDLDAAERGYRAALDAAPEHPYAMHYLGVVEYQRGRASEALPRLLAAAQRRPDEPEFHNNLGLVLAALDRFDEAIAAHRRAIALKPDLAGAWTNLGLALTAANALDDAIAAFDRALALAPHLTEARWNRALALLAAGRFAEGFRDYEARLAVAAFADPSWAPRAPRWDGRDPGGRTILLVAEQGLGDAIQFVRFASVLAARGARVIVQAPRPLATLFRTVEGVAAVVAPGGAPPPHDAWLPLLSLAGTLCIDAASIPARVPYLAADASRRRDVAAALATHGNVLRVGLAWAGNPRNTNDRRRSAPLASLAPLLSLPGVAWFSLSKDDGEDQIPAVPEAARLVSLDARREFDGTAALVAELDLVVTVDTSILHLAGALARPTFALLPFHADWRWRLAREDSDWYPTARLFRQRVPGDWASLVAAVATALDGLRRSR